MPAESSFRFELSATPPSVTEHGNHIREANGNSFPILAANAVAQFKIDMKPGALRVPHWHPNAWELDYCLDGQARFWITGPDNTDTKIHQVIDLAPGQMIFIPQGWIHAIKAVGEKDLQLLLTFNNALPTDIGVPASLSGIGDEIFAQTFGVTPEVFRGFHQKNQFFAPPTHGKRAGGSAS